MHPHFWHSHPRFVLSLVTTAAVLIALVGARPYAGSWNDGASLATVESLVDHHTLAIDRSMFVDPSLRGPGSASPYAPGNKLLNERGTLDKVYIDGHYYAAKPFVPAVLMAAEYWLVQLATGLAAARWPAAFVYFMTLLSSGLAYVVAVACIYELCRRVLGSPRGAAVLAGSFGLGSVALAYSRHVNFHLPQLAAVAAMVLAQHELARRLQSGHACALQAAMVGTLLGLAYVWDQGVGPAIVLCFAPLVVWRTLVGHRAAGALLIALACAAPWIAAQHWLNFEIGHSFAAVNSRPEYLAWPGSPWNRATMSGVYSHANWFRFAAYSAQMLVGKKGFLLHSPLMVAAVVAWGWLLVKRGRRMREFPEIACGAAMCVTIWAVYSWGSTNYSGSCVSIRWFLPMLAPAYYALAVYLRERPQAWIEVCVVAAGSIALNLAAWSCGPWYEHVVPGFWLMLAATLTTWLAYAHRQRWMAIMRRMQGAGAAGSPSEATPHP